MAWTRVWRGGCYVCVSCESVVNVTVDICDFRLMSLDTSRFSREDVCLPNLDVVNCL